MLGFPLGPSAPAVTAALVGTAVSLRLAASVTGNALVASIAFHTSWLAALAVMVSFVHAVSHRVVPRHDDDCDHDAKDDEH